MLYFCNLLTLKYAALNLNVIIYFVTMESNSYSEYATGLRIQGKSELIDTKKRE